MTHSRANEVVKARKGTTQGLKLERLNRSLDCTDRCDSTAVSVRGDRMKPIHDPSSTNTIVLAFLPPLPYCVRERFFCAITIENKMRIKKVNSPLPVHARYLTSIPPHSKTRNKSRSDARTELTPTTCAQNVTPSSAATRAAAGAQIPKSLGETPQKSMKIRVTMSGTGEMCICAAFS